MDDHEYNLMLLLDHKGGEVPDPDGRYAPAYTHPAILAAEMKRRGYRGRCHTSFHAGLVKRSYHRTNRRAWADAARTLVNP